MAVVPTAGDALSGEDETVLVLSGSLLFLTPTSKHGNPSAHDAIQRARRSTTRSA